VLPQVEQLSDEQIDRGRLKRRRDLKYRDEREVFQNYCENSDLFPDESPVSRCGRPRRR
jgi:hypothetical protein